MTRAHPIALVSREVADGTGSGRLQRILGRPLANARASRLVDLGHDGTGYSASWIDASRETPVLCSEGSAAVHVLWTAGDTPGVVEVGVDAGAVGGSRACLVHAGDTLTVPPNTPFRLSAGILAFCFASSPLDERQQAGDTKALRPPTHGLDLFQGHNRRTICAATPDLVLERWKLTEPLELELDRARWHYLANLVTPVAIAWPGGSDLLDRLRARLLPVGMTRLTVVPDGLGYVLLGYRPDLERDVLAPLLAAGYDLEAIAALGIPLKDAGCG